MMVLYSGSTDPFSQRCRFVLFEKGMDFEIRDIDLYHKPEDINVMNPYGEVPILVERDLVLYESNIINEYIDERFPHPQLMPPDPVERARTRLLLFNLEREIFKHVHTLENRASSDEARVKAREAIRDQLTGWHRLLQKRNTSWEMSSPCWILHCPASVAFELLRYRTSSCRKPVQKYAERVFSRPAFIEALTPSERVMRK